ncbi:MAG: RNA methyltransferase [Victivallaceae bacterium]|nr:RNA methyltransferase [Victivallaceae bacterium]
MPLNRRQESLVRSLYTRHGRKKTGCCVAEGVRCCSEVFRSVPELVEFTLLAPEAKVDFELSGEVIDVASGQLGSLGGTVSSQGILTVLRRPSGAEGKPDAPFIPVLDQVGDPGNFGTVVRTAKAAGLDELWYTAGSVDPYSDKVVRSALGAQFSMRLREFADLEAARTAAAGFGYGGFFITDPHRGENCYTTGDLFAGSLVVIGSEANGVDPGVPGRRVTIPMPGGFESLNAAQAATIFIFEFVRRKYMKAGTEGGLNG